jgi:hypothetical protein
LVRSIKETFEEAKLMFVIKQATKDGWVSVARGRDKVLMEKAKRALEKATMCNYVLIEEE